LSNAVKFTLRGSITVEVTARSGGDAAGGGRVRVTDTGSGIAEEDKDRLFERFYRAANTRGRSVEGTGIGLALVRGLLELHGGTIHIDSEVDVGTTVTIDLPPATERSTPVPDLSETENLYVAEALQWLDPGPAEPVVAGDGDRHLVLIADDNADMRRHLDGILSQRWRTIVFADGEAALRGARRYRPDLVVTDVVMPALDGFGLAAAIRADPHLATTPVVMLSARAGIEAASDGYAGGADDYLVKPFTSQELLNRVAARLDAVSRERASREHEAEDTRRETALAELEAALSAAGSTAEAMDALLASPIIAPLGATAAAIGTRTASHVRIDYAGAFRAELRDRYHLTALDAPVPLADVIDTGRPLVMPDTLLADARYLPVTQDMASDVRAGVVYPLRDSGRTVGAIAFMWPAPRDFNPVELDLLADAAVLAGAAIDRVRAVEREHRIAIDFQDQLLDLNRTSAAAVVGAVYEPAGEAMRVGGDWYLVTPLDEPDRIAVCVGDVVGHGLPAATVMSKLRSAVAATALTTPDPDAVLDTVDRYAAAVPGASCATVAYAVVDGAAGTIAYACAGHPYPLLVTPAREVRYLEDGRRPPVTALSPTASTATGHADLPPGALVLLYTDGLIERPGESLTDGFERLAAAAADCAALPTGAACAELVRRMAPADGYRDDVVLLALRATGVTATSFVTVVPARTAQSRTVRHRLHEWLAGMELDRQREHDILLAVDEALVNAIEHGSDLDPRRTVSLEVFADGDTISATVGDTGQWSTDSSASRRTAGRGRGLALMHGLSDTVDIQRTTRGTQVTMRFARTHQSSPTTGVTL
ncbi:MAG TPA: SpoIIE family protein phosphatase, partial [Pseudonocardiaceae bacterium]|nr:SpoIIE family protein phosphatase [Pseudonocardiaceae bacterium]